MDQKYAPTSTISSIHLLSVTSNVRLSNHGLPQPILLLVGKTFQLRLHVSLLLSIRHILVLSENESSPSSLLYVIAYGLSN